MSAKLGFICLLSLLVRWQKSGSFGFAKGRLECRGKGKCVICAVDNYFHSLYSAKILFSFFRWFCIFTMNGKGYLYETFGILKQFHVKFAHLLA